MNITNKYHVDFFSVNNFLMNYSYHIYGIYDQIDDFILKKSILRRSNVLFISSKDSNINS